MKPGKKTKAWNDVRKELIPKFEAAGITRCELQWQGCCGAMYLGFAHSRKRRHITTPEGLREVILACTMCHNQLERMKNMEEVVKGVIEARTTPIKNN